ncbi:replicative DNA helicase [Microbacterium sp. 11MF]|uniref:replicative DNA helicase n=1 Tax=Microbacterium sp. 11MF TaxID=1169146 RepID=UPI000378F559|nr:DnaB-like helicase C-terminal domain-containing protein [Microbacterium sp. 11MF]
MTAAQEAEVALLTAVLITNGAALDDIALTGHDFYEPRHGDIFDAMRREWDQGRPVDAFTLSEAMPNDAALLFGLTSVPAAAGSVPFYADIVAKRALRRRLSSVAAALTNIESGLDAADVADRARTMIEEAIGTGTAKLRFVRDVLDDVMDRKSDRSVFVPSPWEKLNGAIGGFRPGAVYVVAARPGVGKTVIAAQIATQLASDGNVAFASLEMTIEELVARFVSERALISVGHIKDARLTEHDFELYRRARPTLEQLNIAIDDRSGLAPSDIRTFARTVAKQPGGLSGIVVDYMQLMVAKSKGDRHLQVAEFSRQLKILAKDMKVPVIALSQLNRNSEATTLSVPKLSDLRESGAIEQDADVVMLLRKEGLIEDPRADVDLVIDVAKNRHGRTGEIRLVWDGQHSRAVDFNY